MQKHVVKTIGSRKLRVYYVWQPILPSDSFTAAKVMAKKITDRRVHFFWDTKHRLGDAYGEVLKLRKRRPTSQRTHGIAWDMYLLYPAGVKWGKRPPKPAYWQHQLGGLPPKLRLDGPVLRKQVEKRLPAK